MKSTVASGFAVIIWIFVVTISLHRSCVEAWVWSGDTFDDNSVLNMTSSSSSSIGNNAQIPSSANNIGETVTSVDNGRHIAHNQKLRLAALNHPVTGDMRGVRGADYECFRQSRRANLKGTFRAFVASRVQNIDTIVRPKDYKLPVVNLKDELLFNSWRDIFTGAGAPFPYPPKIYSFDGRNIFTDSTWSQKLVWHGADRAGIRNTDAYCDAWDSNSISRMGVASNLLRGKLLDQEKYSCNNAFIVLCAEVMPEGDSAARHRRQVSRKKVHHHDAFRRDTTDTLMSPMMTMMEEDDEEVEE